MSNRHERYNYIDWVVSLNFEFNALSCDSEMFRINSSSPFYKKKVKTIATEEGLKIITEAVIKKSRESISKEMEGNGNDTANKN